MFIQTFGSVFIKDSLLFNGCNRFFIIFWPIWLLVLSLTFSLVSRWEFLTPSVGDFAGRYQGWRSISVETYSRRQTHTWPEHWTKITYLTSFSPVHRKGFNPMFFWLKTERPWDQEGTTGTTSFDDTTPDGMPPHVYRFSTLSGDVSSVSPWLQELGFWVPVHLLKPSPRWGPTWNTTDVWVGCGTNVRYSLGLSLHRVIRYGPQNWCLWHSIIYR